MSSFDGRFSQNGKPKPNKQKVKHTYKRKKKLVMNEQKKKTNMIGSPLLIISSGYFLVDTI